MAKTYGDTIDRLEPEIFAIDAAAFYASAAISLKRIADALDAMNVHAVHGRWPSNYDPSQPPVQYKG